MNVYKMNTQRKKTMKLNNSDYKNILKFYKIDPTGLSNQIIKEKAEHYLAVKLCKCIKSIKYKTSTTASEKRANASEKRAIAICYNSVIRKKGLKTFKFKCKTGVKLLPKKGTRKVKLIKA